MRCGTGLLSLAVSPGDGTAGGRHPAKSAAAYPGRRKPRSSRITIADTTSGSTIRSIQSA